MTAIKIMGLLIVSVFLFNTAYSQTYGYKLCKSNRDYSCYTVKNRDSWGSLFPNPTERDIVMRVNRINNPLIPRTYNAIPKNLGSAHMLEYAPFPQQIQPPGRKMIYVSLNPSVLAFAAYNAQGNLEYWGPVSGGQGWCPDVNRSCNTSTGKFAIYHKKGSWCKSSKYPVGRGGAPMPYCMFFNGGFALHGSYEVPGYNASHGCVRLFIPDAKWLNEEFAGNDNVPVIVSKQI